MKKHIKKILLLSVTFAFLYLVFVNLDIRELLTVMKTFNLKYILFLIISVITGLSFRAVCFKQLIAKTVNPPLTELIALCITAASLNIILPARAGDIFRAVFIGQKYCVNKVKIFGSIMLERIFDVFIIFCFLLIAVFVYRKNELAMNLCIFAGICIIFGAAFAVITYKYNKTDEVCGYIIEKTKNLSFAKHIKQAAGFINKCCNSFFTGFEIIDEPKRLFAALAASAVIWIFECINFLIVIYGFGCHLHWSVTLFIICFIALACMIPSASVFIGPYQFAVIAAFSVYNVNKETALAITFVEQAIVTITTTIIAAIFLLGSNISYKALKEDINQ